MGRRKGISQNEKRLRGHLATALNAIFKNKRGAAADAAAKIGISRQALSLYMREKATPGTETLRLICATLNLRLEIDGAVVAPSDAPQHTEAAPHTQMDLFQAISSVKDKQLKVEILHRGPESMDIKVSINFAEQLEKAPLVPLAK